MHRHLPPRLTRLKQRPFPHERFCCPLIHQYYGLLRLLMKNPFEFRNPLLISTVTRDVALDSMRSLLFRHLLSQHSASSTPESSSGLRFQILHPFCGLRQHLKGSALSCSRQWRANLTMLQSSLNVTDCCFAPPSQRDTSLQHNQSPGSTGRLLLGSLAITETGLAPASK